MICPKAEKILISAILLMCATVSGVFGGEGYRDPLVRVSMLPSDIDVPGFLPKLSKDISKASGVPESGITVVWNTIPAEHMITGGKLGVKYDNKSHPVIVELDLAGFFRDEEIEKIMAAIAKSFERHTSVALKQVFILTTVQDSGRVYVFGEPMKWKDGQNPFDKNATEKSSGKKKGESAVSSPTDSALLFGNPAFEFRGQLRIGFAATGGADFGEILTLLKSIDPESNESWFTAWSDMAAHVYGNADEYRKQGHKISARDAYLRSADYYQASHLFLPRGDKRADEAFLKGRSAFDHAAQLSGTLWRAVKIPYENTTLPGYLMLCDKSGKKRPLLIIHTGLDCGIEELYFGLGYSALRRGYNCLLFEGPGQGAVIKLQNIPFRHDWEKVVTPVVDFALKQQEVDPDRIALFGMSMGGYLAPRAAAFDPRIKACIADGGVFSVYDGWMTTFASVRESLAAKDRAAVNQAVEKQMAESPKIDQFMGVFLETFHCATPYDLFLKLQKYTLEDCVENIRCDMLVCNGQGDATGGCYKQAELLYEKLKSPKTYLLFTDREGAQEHCQVAAPMNSAERILNWLDERFKPEK